MSRKPRTFIAGQPLPPTLTKQELAILIGKSVSRLDELRRANSHPAVREILPRVGTPMFCGRTAQAWVDRQPEEPKYFRRARQARAAARKRAVVGHGPVEQHSAR